MSKDRVDDQADNRDDHGGEKDDQDDHDGKKVDQDGEKYHPYGKKDDQDDQEDFCPDATCRQFHCNCFLTGQWS